VSLPTRPEARWRLALIVTGVLAISVSHYLTPAAYFHLHLAYQRLYYLPILFGAFWFGLRGGLLTALFTSILYLPHIFLHWGHEPIYRSNQLAEILLFFVIATVAGVLIERIRREQERHRRTAEQLARAYEQLQASVERLRLLDRLSVLGALSAAMAHEIKNPLGSIMGSMEILESAVPPEDEKREFVAILKKEIGRLSDIVTRQLDLVRPERSERSPQDVGEIVRSVVELTRREAETREVCIELELPERPAVAVVDGRQIRQVILNLVLNAIQALEQGGEVRVAVSAGERCVRVRVEDDGPGIPEEEPRRIFEPFFTTRQGGTGLGLSIAFQIADLHGGDLRAENRDEGGARFSLELPLEGAAAPAAAPAEMTR
jgi:signal transduction histidine kinase